MKLKDFVKQHGGTMSDAFGMPPDMLDPNPDNLRIDNDRLRAHIRGLADSIKERGFLRTKPLVVRQLNGRLVVMDGNCRLLATRIAISEGKEIKTIPCLSEPAGTDDADRVCDMLNANNGLTNTPEEVLAGVKKLLSYGWTDTEIAGRLGKSRAWLANLMDLAASPPEVRAAVADGSVSSTFAVKLVREHGSGAATVIADAKAKTGRAHVTERHVKTVNGTAVAVTAVPVKPSLEQAARDLIAAWDANEDYTAAIEALRAALP